jgi:biopolymer transport protein ExbB
VYILELFERGGLVMYPLLLCSILVVAVAFERFFVFHGRTADKKRLRDVLTAKLDARDWQGAQAVCAASPNVLARVLSDGLSYHKDPVSMKEAFEDRTALEAARLRKNLGYLDVIVTMAPLLGLLGTVVGMIGSFKVLDVAGHDPAAITGGVGEALVATATGLCVAVLALCVHTYFAHRLDFVITDIEDVCVHALAKARSEKT